MKIYLKLIPHPSYAEANLQTLSVATDLINWTHQEEDFYQRQSPDVLLAYLKSRYSKKFPQANFITVADYFNG